MPQTNFDSAKTLLGDAAMLAKKQAELTKISSVLLPKLYYKIGKHINSLGDFPVDLVSLHEKISQLESQLEAKLASSDAEGSKGFAGRTKELVARVSKAAGDATISVQLSAAFTSLGREAVRLHGEEFIPSELRADYSSLIVKQDALKSEIDCLTAKPGKGVMTPRRVAIAGAVICVLLGLFGIRSAISWITGNGSVISAKPLGKIAEESAENTGLLSPEAPVSLVSDRGLAARTKPESAKEAATVSLTDAIVRVPRGADANPGKTLEAVHRLTIAKNLNRNTELGRMLTAYQKGNSHWIGEGGTPRSMKVIGLAAIDWPSQKVIPAWKGHKAGNAPFVRAEKEDKGTRVTLSPVEIAEDLSCSVSFFVISNTPENSRMEELDFLAGQVELYGGGYFVNEASPFIDGDTFFDIWSSTNDKRYSITRWQPSRPVGHIAPAYGPLLFDVLNSDPDFLLLENLKIELPERFRAGCRELCAEVLKLRKAQGQMGSPVCRSPQQQ